MRSACIVSGMAGSLVLTLFHQLLKANVADAPRMDKLGRQALKKMLIATGCDVPRKANLQKITLVGDLVGNAAYYSLVGVKPASALTTGAVLGLAAGIGAVVLPGELGLNPTYSNATTKTQVLTIVLYLTGGLVAGAVQQILSRKKRIQGTVQSTQ